MHSLISDLASMMKPQESKSRPLKQGYDSKIW